MVNQNLGYKIIPGKILVNKINHAIIQENYIKFFTYIVILILILLIYLFYQNTCMVIGQGSGALFCNLNTVMQKTNI